MNDAVTTVLTAFLCQWMMIIRKCRQSKFS